MPRKDTKVKTPWTQEMKDKAAATRAASKRAREQADVPAAPSGPHVTYIKHMADDVLLEARQGLLTLKTLRKHHALALLAYVEMHSR